MQPALKLIGSIRRGEIRWLNYLLASVLALGSDAGLFLLLLDSGLSPMAASACATRWPAARWNTRWASTATPPA